MHQLSRWTRRSRLGVYLQFLVILLVLTVAIMYVMAIGGCSCDDPPPDTSPEEERKSTQKASYQCQIQRTDAVAAPQARTQRTLTGKMTGTAHPGNISYSWFPPDGASGYTWGPNQQPENPNGPPPFKWRDVAPQTEINFGFNLPPLESGITSSDFLEGLYAEHGDGSSSSARLTTRVVAGQGTAQQ